MNTKKSRSHLNAGHRVFRITHTHGELAGKETQIHGRAWGLGVKRGLLIVTGEREARVAVGFLAEYDNERKELDFAVFAPMLTNWEIVERAGFFDPNQSITSEQVAACYTACEPRVPSRPITVEGRRRIKGVLFIKKFEVGRTQEIW